MTTKIHYILLSDSSFRKKNVKKSICYTARNNILSALFNISSTQRKKVVASKNKVAAREDWEASQSLWDATQNKKASARRLWDDARSKKVATRKLRVDYFECRGDKFCFLSF